MGKAAGGKKGRKVGRHSRRPHGGKHQWSRTYQNKLNRVNRDRAKSGKPPLNVLPGYNIVTGEREGKK